MTSMFYFKLIMKGCVMVMASITVKLTVDGVEQELTPKRVLNNVELNMDTAKEYLIKSGLYTAEQLTTDDDVVTAFWNTYCNERFVFAVADGTYYPSYYRNDDDRLALPYPFGNKSILSLGIGLYNDSSGNDTSFLSEAPISFGVCDSITKSDTSCSMTKIITGVSGVFNKISFFGNFVVNDSSDYDGYRVFHGWSENNISKVYSAQSGMLYDLDGVYYLFVKGATSKSTTGVYAMTDISSISQSTEKFTHNSYTLGGVYDGKPFICYKSNSSGNVYGYVISYEPTSGSFTQSGTTIYTGEWLSSDTIVYAVYAFSPHRSIMLVDESSSVKLYLFVVVDEFPIQYEIPVTFYDTAVYDLYKSFITMLDGVLYLCMTTTNGDITLHRVDTDTGDYTTATKISLTNLKTEIRDRVYPCNNGKWYFSDTSQIVELTPDIPVLEIELEQPIDATSGTCSLELNINISKGDND